MEYSGSFYDRGQESSTKTEAVWRKPKLEQLGQVTIGEVKRPGALPRAAETVIGAALKPEGATPTNAVYSSWHKIERTGDGQIKSLEDQHYGQAMLQELNAEQGLTGRIPPKSSPVLSAVVNQATHPTPQPLTSIQQSPPGQTALGDAAAGQPHVALPLMQPSVSMSPTTSSPAHQLAPMTGALNPNSNLGKLTPQSNQPQLSAGQLISDPARMLPKTPFYRLGKVLTSPWLWLAVGVGLLVWFI